MIKFRFEQDFTNYGPIYDAGRWFVKYKLVGLGGNVVHLSNAMEFVRRWLTEEFGDEPMPGFVEYVPRVDAYVSKPFTPSGTPQQQSIGLWLLVTSDFDGRGWQALPVGIEAVQRIVCRGKEWLEGVLSFAETLENASQISE
ncbi:hypothetical protein [Rhodococcus sp. IEGM 1302]|uniref:hypothetical protein n=1 Tax=Rhodococcus sp. IEGM 1302 TaxID=3047093 RepID=UPI0024B7E1CA|nr:hypothetical protein [Rhodococcus sp. IEGM 1302]MDI9943266.1 hypothetical protein [Rhodococcus sp. IEGM 1302]